MENMAGEGRRQLRRDCKTPKRSELAVIKTREDVVTERKGEPKFKPNYNVDKFVLLFGSLSDELKTSFRNGPFRHLLDVPSLVLTSRLVNHFIHTMDNDFKSFSLGGRKIYFGPEDFAICMGLTLKGRLVVWSNRPCPSVLQSRYKLIDNKSPTLEGLERLVKLEIEANNMEGSLRAFYAYTLECLIFSRRRAIETSHWHLLDNLEEIGKYAWGVAAYEYLRKSLLNISKDDISEKRLDGCSYMLKILVLERGHAPLMVGEEARKVPRIGRWTVGRMSKCKAEELLNCEPEKVIEWLKIDDWEVDFAADMGVINENVVDEKKELSTPPPAVIQNDDSIATVMKRRVEELEAEVDCGKRKLEWAREVYGVDWSLYPENVDRSTGGNEMSVKVVREEYDDVCQDYVMSETEESPGIPGRVKIDHRTRKPSFKVLSPYERTVVARKSSRNINNAVIFEEWVVMHQSYKPSDKEIERLKRLEKKLLMDDSGLSIEVGSKQDLRVDDVRMMMSSRRWVSDLFVDAYSNVLSSLPDSHPVMKHHPFFLSSFVASKLMEERDGHHHLSNDIFESDLAKFISKFTKWISTANELIFQPYVDGNHWRLMVADSLSKSLLWLDSLNDSVVVSSQGKKLGSMMVKYALYGWHENISSWPICKVVVPQQKNSHDCAMYMMSFMVSYAATRRIIWFTPEESKSFRSRMLLEVLDGTLLPAFCI